MKTKCVVARRRFHLDSEVVTATMSRIDPENPRDLFVLIAGIQYPPKQVLEAVTGLDRADFSSHQARAVLQRLGFETGRTGGRAREAAIPYGAEQDIIEPPKVPWDDLVGREGEWVAIKEGRLLHGHEDPLEVVAWLRAHNVFAETMFRVHVPGEPILGDDAIAMDV